MTAELLGMMFFLIFNALKSLNKIETKNKLE